MFATVGAKMFAPNIESLHVELTSRCTLACQRCRRTMHPDEFTPDDLSLETIRNSLVRAQFPSVRHIILSGNYGDPIYHRQFHSVIEHLKKEGFVLRIDTNGSFRKPEWWVKTSRILKKADRITFSVDGLRDTNAVYRIGARWKDIMEAVAVLRGRVHLQWKFIVFKHNEHQVNEAIELANELGFDEFKLVRSDRFGGKWHDGNGIDKLAPSPRWRSATLTRSSTYIDRDKTRITPRCIRGENIFVSNEGWLLPCCYSHMQIREMLSGGYNATDADAWFVRNLQSFDLKRRSVHDILDDPIWEQLAAAWESDSVPRVCVAHCGTCVRGMTADELHKSDRSVTSFYG
jgi:MoaA/NifB/PqqE/SkfB family radical SAM enzyme